MHLSDAGSGFRSKSYAVRLETLVVFDGCKSYAFTRETLAVLGCKSYAFTRETLAVLERGGRCKSYAFTRETLAVLRRGGETPKGVTLTFVTLTLFDVTS